MSRVSVSWLMMRMKNMASGAKRTICSSELMATRMAQYSSSPPARPFQIRTWGPEQSQCQSLDNSGEGERSNHGNASPKSDEYKTDAEIALVRKESPGKGKLGS